MGPEWDTFTRESTGVPVQALSFAASENQSWQSSWVDQTQGCWFILTHKRLIYNQNTGLLIYSWKRLTLSPFLPIGQLQGKRDHQKVAQWARNFDKGFRWFKCSIMSGSAHLCIFLPGIYPPDVLDVSGRGSNSRILLAFVRVCQVCPFPSFPLLNNPFLTYTLLFIYVNHFDTFFFF